MKKFGGSIQTLRRKERYGWLKTNGQAVIDDSPQQA